MNTKRISKFFLVLGALTSISLTSCEQDLDTYTGENGIYFDTRYEGGETMSDTITVSWGMKPSDVVSREINLVVKLFGHTAPVDRKFNIEVGSEPGDENAAEAGIDFIMPATEFIMPAGKASVSIPITLLRRQGLHLNDRRLTVKLIENPDLKFLFSRKISDILPDGTAKLRPIDYQRVVLMNEKFPIPIWWSYRGQPYFGNWSMTKAALICDVMGIDREDWLDDSALSTGYLKFCGRYMYNYLKDNPQFEDDGTPMTMGPQSSY